LSIAGARTEAQDSAAFPAREEGLAILSRTRASEQTEMIRTGTIAALVLALSTSVAAAAPASGERHWGYTGHGGPTEWGTLSPEFETCGLGKHQSPIDIHGAKVVDLPAIRFDYHAAPLAIVDNGHTIQVNYAPGSTIDIGGARYELVQFHFHRPSEEKVDGKSHAMVAHLVHRNAEGQLAVVAVLLDGGGANAMIDTIWKHLPPEKEKPIVVTGVNVDAAALLPKDHGYFTFQGSLTTPPCSENVTWIVLKEPVRIANADIDAFGRIYPMNARPVQPTNDREIDETK
jgi:carbonic anhydrase